MSGIDNNEVDAVEVSKGDSATHYSQKKRRILVLLLVYSAVLGIVGCFLPEEDKSLNFIVSLPWLILAVSWCFADAAERDHRIGLITKSLLIFMLIVGLPIYLFQTRGLGGFKSVAFATLLAGAMFACAFVTEYATLYVGEVAGLWR